MSKGLSISNLRLNVAATGNDIVDEVTLTVEPGRVLGLVCGRPQAVGSVRRFTGLPAVPVAPVVSAAPTIAT